MDEGAPLSSARPMASSRRPAALLALLAPVAVSAERVTEGLRMQYTFERLDCDAGRFPDMYEGEGDSSRSLVRRPELGATCFPDHVGCELDPPDGCCDAASGYTPLSSGPGDLKDEEPTTGLTIEMWVQFDKLPASLGESLEEPQVIFEVSPDSTVDPCSRSNGVPVRVEISKQGCVKLTLRTPKAGTNLRAQCLDFPSIPFNPPEYCVGDRTALLDTVNPYHIVISLSNSLVSAPADGTPRYAMYINGEAAINSKTGTNIGAQEVRETLQQVDADYDVTTAWTESDNRIRVGSTAPNLAGDNVMPFEGSIYYVALYRKPLSAKEVKDNFDAGYANSEPVITNQAIAVLEDTCTPLVAGPLPLTSLVDDWDNKPPLSRGQTFTATADVTTLKGTLHTDAACATPPAEGEAAPEDPVLGFFYLSPLNEYGSPFTSFVWTVTDSEGASATANFAINVTSVDDPPIAFDSAAEAYIDLERVLVANGTDVDSDVAAGTLKIVEPPKLADVYAAAEGEEEGVWVRTGAPLSVGSIAPGERLVYLTTADFGEISDKRVIGTDVFSYQMVDGSGLASDTVTFNITILNGLDAVSRSFDGPYTDDLNLVEDTPGAVLLQGINQNAPQGTEFILASLPNHGRVHQYDAANDVIGPPINETGVALWNATAACENYAGFYCPSLWYVPDDDYFSFPKTTRDGEPPPPPPRRRAPCGPLATRADCPPAH